MLSVKRRGRVGAPFFALWTVFWAFIAVLSLVPSAISPLVPIFGLTNVKDVVYSTAILVLFLISTLMFVQLSAVRTSLVNVVSQSALAASQLRTGRFSSAEGNERVVVLIPARNEETTIGKVVREVQELRLEDPVIIVVNDGSEDQTAHEASDAGAFVISHSTNLGIGTALKTGYDAAAQCGAKWLVQIDADRQHSPQDIPLLLNKLKVSNADLVIGSRFLGPGAEKMSLTRKAGIRFYTRLVNTLTGLKLTDVTCGLRAFKMTCLQVLMFKSRESWAIETTLRAGRAGLTVTEVSILDRRRQSGMSQFNSVSLFFTYHYRALKQILNAYF